MGQEGNLCSLVYPEGMEVLLPLLCKRTPEGMSTVEKLSQYPKEAQQKALRQAHAHEFKQSLFHLCKYGLGYKDMTWSTHRKMIEALEGPTKRKCIVMPRGTFKSSIGVVGYSIWSMLRNPDIRILIDSEVYSNSKNFLREIKAHLESERFISCFGEFKSPTNWSEGEITIKQRTRPYKEASITCGGIETVKVGQHYDLIIGDDLNSGNNSSTPEARKKVIDHYRMNTAILEPEGIYVVIGTRYAIDDVIGFIIENEIKPGLLGKGD